MFVRWILVDVYVNESAFPSHNQKSSQTTTNTFNLQWEHPCREFRESFRKASFSRENNKNCFLSSSPIRIALIEQQYSLLLFDR